MRKGGVGVVGVYGLWPGVVAMVADADMSCVPCGRYLYGEDCIQAVIEGAPGYEQLTDHEGNPLSVVLWGSEDLHGMHCGWCMEPLCDEHCSCYASFQTGLEGGM